jgi:NTE family protein
MALRGLFVLLVAVFLVSCSNGSKFLINPPKKMPPPRVIKNVNVALVLGGGGAKGIAHLGVIEVLEKNHIPIDLIVGTSAGSIVGAMYADYQDSQLLYDNLIKIDKWELLDFSLFNTLYFFSDLSAPIQGYYLENYIVKNLSVNNIEELKIPFVAVATDLTHEKSTVISSGPISTAVLASSAIPPFFRPVRAYNKLLVDGGVMEPVPVFSALEYNPKLTIAVDISSPGREFNRKNMWDVTQRSMYLSYYKLSQYQSKHADIMIHPDMNGFGMFEDGDNGKLYQLGRDAALKALPKILELMKAKGIKQTPR